MGAMKQSINPVYIRLIDSLELKVEVGEDRTVGTEPVLYAHFYGMQGVERAREFASREFSYSEIIDETMTAEEHNGLLIVSCHDHEDEDV